MHSVRNFKIISYTAQKIEIAHRRPTKPMPQRSLKNEEKNAKSDQTVYVGNIGNCEKISNKI